MGGLLGGAGLLSGLVETGEGIYHMAHSGAQTMAGQAAVLGAPLMNGTMNLASKIAAPISMVSGLSHMLDGHSGIGDRVAGGLEAFSGGVGSLGLAGSAASAMGAGGAGAAMSGAAAAAAPAAAVAGAGAAGWGLGRAIDNGVGWASRQMGGDGRNLSDRIGDGLYNTLGAGPGLWLADHLPSWMQ